MHLEKTLGIQRVAVQADLHQPGTRQHKHHKMHHRLLAADHDAVQLTGIDLALNAQHRLNDRLVIAKLAAGNLLLEGLHIPADAPVGYRQINAALSQAPASLTALEPLRILYNFGAPQAFRISSALRPQP